MGRAGEALGASLSASAIGGVLGALAFVAAIPIARPIVTSFGPPEFLLLSLIGMSMISAVSREGSSGLTVATSASCRDGRPQRPHRRPAPHLRPPELWDGLGLPALVAGLFIVPEMLTPTRFADDIAERSAKLTTIKEVFQGMAVTLRYPPPDPQHDLRDHRRPDAGARHFDGGVAVLRLRRAHDEIEIPFGQGAIAGVIAPEAANNSKEGGAMIPTLFFGIPGSSSMAIMMAALASPASRSARACSVRISRSPTCWAEPSSPPT